MSVIGKAEHNLLFKSFTVYFNDLFKLRWFNNYLHFIQIKICCKKHLQPSGVEPCNQTTLRPVQLLKIHDYDYDYNIRNEKKLMN